MLDIHACHGTPGAATLALAAELATICSNDGASVAGVPIMLGARLIMWGGTSLIANTIGAMQLVSQDQIDPLNGEQIDLGTISLQNEFHKFTNLLYASGKRAVKMSTNTAQADTNEVFTLDYYEGGPALASPNGEFRFKENIVCIRQLLSQDVANTWNATPFAPATPIPNGKYALLGIYPDLQTEAHVYRFVHADFNGRKPGFPQVGVFNSDILGHQKGMKDIFQSNPGYQFVALAEVTDKAVIPVFTVSNAATGLNIESLAPAATDTPVVSLNLAKVA